MLENDLAHVRDQLRTGQLPRPEDAWIPAGWGQHDSTPSLLDGEARVTRPREVELNHGPDDVVIGGAQLSGHGVRVPVSGDTVDNFIRTYQRRPDDPYGVKPR